MNEGTCRSCGAKILWAEMQATGKKNPLSFEPTEMGNVLIQGDGRAVALGPAGREAAIKRGEKLYLSHFVDCPNAAQHKKPKAS